MSEDSGIEDRSEEVDNDPTDASVLEISTDAIPTKKMKIDGVAYDLYSMEHLSPEQESKVTSTFSQFDRVYRSLEKAKNDDAADKLATKLRHYRERLIGLMTSIPSSVYKELNIVHQGQILGAIQDEIGAETDEEDDLGDGDEE